MEEQGQAEYDEARGGDAATVAKAECNRTFGINKEMGWHPRSVYLAVGLLAS